MLKGSALSNLQKSVGQRVCIEKNKYGTLQYVGTTHFADGVWCGVELDEETGEIDGMLNSIHYFTCKKNCGVFVSPSEVSLLNDTTSYSSTDLKVEQCIDFNMQNFDLHNLLQSSHENSESFVISKRSFLKQLSVISEENSEHLKSVSFPNFNTETDFRECEHFSSVDQENKVSFKELEEDYESDDSLGILSHLKELDQLDEFGSCDNLIDNFHTNLNTTIILSNSPESQVNVSDNNRHELRASPIHIMPKYLSSSKSEESPVCLNVSTPKFASTPKHEPDYSYVFEEVISTGQNFSFDICSNKENIEDEKHLESSLNKTKEIKVKFEQTLPVITNVQNSGDDEGIDSEKSILNRTCNINKPMNATEILLNKTFENFDLLLGDAYILPVVSSHEESNIQHHFIQHENPDSTDMVTNNLKSQQKCIDEISENILNVTCNILKPSDVTHAVPKSLGDKFSENPKNILSNILNATMSNFEEAEKNVENDFVFLNTTYEKIDVPLELESQLMQPVKHISNSDLNANNSKTISKNKSKNISFSRTDLCVKNEFRNNTSEFRKTKNTRKSVGCSDKNMANSEFKGKHRRNSYAGSTCRSLKSNELSTNLCRNMPVKCTSNENNSQSSFAKSCPKSALDLSKNMNGLKPAISSIKVKGINPVSRGKSKENNLLNETINFTPLIEGTKTVIKKSCTSVHLPFKKGSVESCEMPSEGKTRKNYLFNETVNDNTFISGEGKTIMKKPHTDMHSSLNISVESCDVSLEEKSKENQSPNTVNTVLIPEGGKTVVKKPRASMHFPLKSSVESFKVPSEDIYKGNHLVNETANFRNYNSEGKKTTMEKNHASILFSLKQSVENVPSKDKFSENHLLNATPNTVPIISEGGKTVVKKPHTFMHFLPKKSSIEFSDVPLFKTEKRSSLNISASTQSNTAQALSKESSVSSSNLNKFSAVSNTEGKQKVLRKLANTASAFKSHIPAMKSSSSHQGASKISVSRSQSADCHPIQKYSSKTTLISGSQRRTQQTTQVHKIVTRTTSDLPSSRIPSVSQSKKKEIPRVKPSVMTAKTSVVDPTSSKKRS